MYCIDLYWENRKRLQTASWHPRWGTCSLDAQGPRQTLPTSPGSSGERTKWNRTRLKRQMSQMSHIFRQIFRQRSLPFFHSPFSYLYLETSCKHWLECGKIGDPNLQWPPSVAVSLLFWPLFVFVLRNPGRDGIHRKKREAQWAENGHPHVDQGSFCSTLLNILEPFLEKRFIKGEVQHSLTQFSAPRLWQGSC